LGLLFAHPSFRRKRRDASDEREAIFDVRSFAFA
jgi:hypothetical protein